MQLKEAKQCLERLTGVDGIRNRLLLSYISLRIGFQELSQKLSFMLLVEIIYEERKHIYGILKCQ